MKLLRFSGGGGKICANTPNVLSQGGGITGETSARRNIGAASALRSRERNADITHSRNDVF